MATNVGMYSATNESVTVPVGRDRKIRTALRTNQIVDSLPSPLRKKKTKVELAFYECLVVNKLFL